MLLAGTMTIELIEIAVAEKSAHPRLTGRVVGRVRAVLQEDQAGREQTHDLSIPVWADVADGSSEADIDMALMLKASDIIKRLRANLAG
jgi:hypothetical protein